VNQLTLQRVILALALAVTAGAQSTLAQMPPAPVRFTEAREYQFRGEVTLPATVAARTSSLVASEVAGLVAELVVREGDTVRRGQAVVRLRRQNLELRLTASRAGLKEASARLELAERSLERSRELFESGVISQQQLDDAVSEADAWHGRVEQGQAETERLEDDLARSNIPAPFTGVVVAEHVGVGEWLDVGGAVVEMVSLTDIEVGLEVAGRVSAVIPRADPQSRTFPVKARIENPGGQIGVGMLARVALGAGALGVVTIVPKDAVVDLGGGQQVFIIGDDNTVSALPVSTGRGLGEWVVIIGDCGRGDLCSALRHHRAEIHPDPVDADGRRADRDGADHLARREPRRDRARDRRRAGGAAQESRRAGQDDEFEFRQRWLDYADLCGRQ
jgi:multidrug efflux pump subunit AcrA (membrane-fusion protein)